MDLWILILITIIGGLIFYLWRSMSYFKRLGIPHESPWPIIGNMLPIIQKHEHFIEHVSKYSKNWPDAKYVGFYMFNKPAIIVSDIELVKQITVKHFDSFHDHDVFVNEDTDPLISKGLLSLRGNKWREARSILSPAFTSNKMKQMFELMTACARNFVEFIAENVGRGDLDIDIKDASSKYTTDVIATCAFGISINSLKNPDNEFYVLGKKAMKITPVQMLKRILSMLLPVTTKIFNLQMFDAKLTDFFFNVVKSTVEIRREKGIVRPDMIQLMMESRQKANSLQLDIVDMTSQAFLFFLGGFETSSSLTAYAAIELAKNQDIQNRLIEEIDLVMTTTNGNPTYEAINSMVYLEAVLYETLRYYPIGGFMDRVCVSEFELPPSLPGLKPVKVRPGDLVWVPSYRIHMDVEHYDHPNVFSPDRFLGQKINVNTPTFLAFGIGPRSCIGNRFALLENKILLFYLLAKYKFQMSPKLKQPITYTKDNFVALIEGGFWVRIVPRN